jgi:hypothetical protein
VRSVIVCIALIVVADISAQKVQRSSNIATEVVSAKTSQETWSMVPAGFNGMKFGSSEQEAAAAAGALNCAGQKLGERAYRRCTPKEKAARYAVDGVALDTAYIFLDGKLVAVQLQPGGGFRVPAFDAVRDQFVKEFGEPTSEDSRRSRGTVSETKFVKGKGGVTAGLMVAETKRTNVNSEYESAAWTNDKASVSVSGRNEKFFSATVETAEWRTAREEFSRTLTIRR